MLGIGTQNHLSSGDKEHIDNNYQISNEPQREDDQISQLREECCITEKNHDDNKYLQPETMCNRFLTTDAKPISWRERSNNEQFRPQLFHKHNSRELNLESGVAMDVSSNRTSGAQSRRSSTSELYATGRHRSASTSSQSDFLQNICKKYPQAFFNRLSNGKIVRPSRGLFSSSGLQVHFQDDKSSIDDASSLCSERPHMKWEREEMFGNGMDKEAPLSPAPSAVSDIVTSNRLHATSESLKRLLQHRKYHRSKLASDLEFRMKRHSISSTLTSQDPLSALEKELEHREQMLQGLNKQHKLDYNQNIKSSFRSSHWRVQSPESPPDSAIEIDTSSVQSASSGDKPIYSTSQSSPRVQDDGRTDFRSHGKILVRKRVVHRDSDVDSGITRDEVLNRPPPYSTTLPSRSEVEVSPYNRHCQRSGPMKADHSIALNLNFSNRTDEEDSIAQEIVTAQMTADINPLRHTYGRVHFEDEVDDTDPRLGIPAVTKEENEVMEMFRKRRSPTQFIVKRSCTTAREEKAKSNQARSDNRVSVLCSPRKNDEVLIYNDSEDRTKAGVNMRGKYSSFYSSQPNLSSTLRVSTENGNRDTKLSGIKENFDDKKSKTDSRVLKAVPQAEPDELLNLQEMRSLSKSQPNLVPCLKSSFSSGQTDSSNSEQETRLVAAGTTMEDNLSINNPFIAKNPRKKLHLKKYFKTKKGRYDPSIDQHCFDMELGQGMSMPDLTISPQKERVQYSNMSKHRSMHNIHYKSSDIDSDSDSENMEKQRPQNPYYPESGPGLLGDMMGKRKKASNKGEGHPGKDTLDRRYESDSSSSQSCLGKHKNAVLSPYETSVIHLDNQGVDVNQLIESDSDSFSAKCVVIPKNPNGKHNGLAQNKVVLDEYQQERRYRKKGDRPYTPTKSIEISKQLYANMKGRESEKSDHVIRNKSNLDNQKEDAAEVSRTSSLNSNDKSQDVPNGGANRTYTVLHKPGNEDLQEGTNQHAKDKDQTAHDSGGSILMERGLRSKLSVSTPNISGQHNNVVDIEVEGEGAIQVDSNDRCNDSNLVKSKELSASRQSLADRMGNFKDSARQKFKAIKKAVSMDKGIDKIEGEEKSKVKKKKKGFFGLFRKRSKRKGHAEFREMTANLDSNGASDIHNKLSSCHSIDSVGCEGTVSSRLFSINPDGTQIVEIRKPENKAIDFFISRGNSQYNHGIFVSRFIGTDTNRYTGLLSVGDEILEVNGLKVHDLLLDDVYSLLSNNDRLNITILPLLARKDI